MPLKITTEEAERALRNCKKAMERARDHFNSGDPVEAETTLDLALNNLTEILGE